MSAQALPQHEALPSAVTPEEVAKNFELGVWHALFNWTTLSSAVKENMGGPESADKRDFLAGAIAEQFVNDTETDTFDIEDMIRGYMEDEFNLFLEDESHYTVADKIVQLRRETLEGNFNTVKAMQELWLSRHGKEVSQGQIKIQEPNQDVDEDEDEDDEEDVDMDDAPQLVASKPRENQLPEVDEDGFTQVSYKKNAKK